MSSENYSGKLEGEYTPKSYFERRLSIWKDLRGTGHRRFSLAYNQAMYQAAADRLQQVLQHAGIDLAGRRVLDLGAGLGYFVQKYLDWGAGAVTAVDITQVSVDHLHQVFPDQEVVLADIADPQLALPQHYDLVAAISMIFHITDDVQFRQALHNMCACVRPGGALLIVDAFTKPILPNTRYVRLRPLSAYQAILAKRGLRQVSLTPMYYVLGRSWIPILVPALLRWQPALRLWVHLDRWLETHSRSNLDGLKYLLAVRDA
jgi:SAM-dependent methyltransferase